MCFLPAGSWSQWSQCNAPCDDTGQIIRFYNLTTPASGGGRACPESDEAVEARACNGEPCPVAPVDCVGRFMYGDCSAICGGGVQQGVFLMTTSAADGGQECSYANQSTTNRPCNTQQCVYESQFASMVIQVNTPLVTLW